MTPAAPLFLLFLSELVAAASGIKWLALATATATDHIALPDSCDVLTGLNRRQKQVCRRHVEIMDAVREGAQIAIDECQHQFTTRRWNCSTVDPVSVFGNALNQGTREAAFVHAISAAGVAHSVTRACSSGNVERCGCDRTVRGKSEDGFEWSGCSDNIAFGAAFCETFVDARERARGKRVGRALMNLHNNEAGRKLIEDNMTRQCKCHGVSGSCELKTCWKAMPSFRAVGEKLKEKFDGATEVEEQSLGSRRQLVPRNDQFKPHTEADLVYLQSSPDFCEGDARTGSLGTHGRLCSKSSKAIDGCELMCCGRGYNTRRRVIVERCMCKFHWCCYVKCQQCPVEVEEYTCR